ncbi:MAG TPA: zf-HC2 domain-containing protein [Acidobacteriota bacterium]|nr:zf-HC2 domain-containing protein [Acidobacteriota bacterium]
MNCLELQKLSHEYLDGELSGSQESQVEDHLESCGPCRGEIQELRFLQNALAVRAPLPQASSQLLWRNFRRRAFLTWGERLHSALERFNDCFRDLESRVLWARLGAVPLGLAFMALFITQMGEFSNSIIPTLRAVGSGPTQVVFDTGRVNDEHQAIFVDIVRHIPGEDHAAVVASVDESGRVKIEEVVDYPQSQLLLDALEDNLRSTRFASSTAKRAFVQLHSTIEVVAPESDAYRGM